MFAQLSSHLLPFSFQTNSFNNYKNFNKKNQGVMKNFS